MRKSSGLPSGDEKGERDVKESLRGDLELVLNTIQGGEKLEEFMYCGRHSRVQARAPGSLGSGPDMREADPGSP